jgi:hypothetical protein
MGFALITHQSPIYSKIELSDFDKELGIIGPEARNENFVYSSATLTPEAITIDLRALNVIRTQLPSLLTEPKKFLHPVPSVYFVGNTEFAEWRNGIATATFPYIALTCLSDFCIFGFLPHGEAFRDEFKKLVRADNRKVQSSSKHDLKNAPDTYRIPFRRGDVIVTVPGMPFFLYDENSPPLVKVSSFDYIKHFDTRMKVWREAFTLGGWKMNSFNEASYYYLVKEKESKFRFLTNFDNSNLGFFTKSNFVGGVKQMSANMTMRQLAMEEIKKMPPGPEKMAKVAELRKRTFPDEGASPKPAAPVRKREAEDKKDDNPAETKVGTAPAQEILAKYEQLVAEVKTLDPRVWNPKDLTVCAERAANLKPQANTSEIASFKKVLKTLEGRIESAKETEKTQVPVWEAKLAEIKKLLDENDKLLNETSRKKERGFWQGYKDKYENVLARKNTYWEAKTVNTVNVKVIEGLTKMKSGLEKLQRNSSDEESGEGQAEGQAEGLEQVRPELVVETNFPLVITTSAMNGSDGWRDYIREINLKDREVYSKMIMSHGRTNKTLDDLYKTFRQEFDQLKLNIMEYTKKGENEKVDFDFTKVLGYKKYLDEAVEFYKNRPEVQKTKAPVNRKKTGCKSCKVGQFKKLFPDDKSDYCAHCFIQNKMDEFKKYEDKAAVKITALEEDEDLYDLWSEKIDTFNNLLEAITENFDKMTDDEAKVKITVDKWNKLSNLIERIKGIITPKMLEDVESDDSESYVKEKEDGDDDDDEDEEEVEPVNLVSNDNLPQHESEAKFTGESDEDEGPKRKRPDSDLATEVIHTMWKLPVKSVHNKLLKLFHEGDGKREFLFELVKELKNTKEIYGIELTNTESGRKVMHDVYYETQDEADQWAISMENSKLSARVVKKEI